MYLICEYKNIYIFTYLHVEITSHIYQHIPWPVLEIITSGITTPIREFSHAGASNASSWRCLKEPGRKLLQKAHQSKGCGGGHSTFNTKASKTIAFGRKPAYESMKRSHTAESYIRNFAKRTLFCFWFGNSKLKIIKKRFYSNGPWGYLSFCKWFWPIPKTVVYITPVTLASFVDHSKIKYVLAFSKMLAWLTRKESN